MDPAVIFLDEPMASLDPPTRRGLLADLERIFRSLSTAVVWVTHDTEEALAVADLTTFLVEGEIVQHGATAQVFNSPATQEVADYLGLDMWFEGVVEPAEEGVSRLVLPGGADLRCVRRRPDPPSRRCTPRTSCCSSSPPSPEARRCATSFRAPCARCSHPGRTSRVVLDWAGGRIDAAVTRAACEDLGIHPGQTLYAAVKATAIQVLPRSGGHGQEET